MIVTCVRTHKRKYSVVSSQWGQELLSRSTTLREDPIHITLTITNFYILIIHLLPWSCVLTLMLIGLETPLIVNLPHVFAFS